MGRETLSLPHLSFQHVSYSRDGRTVLEDLSFEVASGETLVILGRSGSGKTTALRLINRMLEPTSGTVRVNGEDVMAVDPIALRRRIGYVIQDFGLLPHWSVEANVLLIPRLLGWNQEEQRKRARELLAEVGLAEQGIAGRRPAHLSGGQRQRVAVARALAARPSVLLFDEPFGALDPVTRHGMQQQFLQLRKQYELVSVFVTHDLLEALILGTRIAVLNAGRLEALVAAHAFWDLQTPEATAFRETLPPNWRAPG